MAGMGWGRANGLTPKIHPNIHPKEVESNDVYIVRTKRLVQESVPLVSDYLLNPE
jgi:hypothetical protein